MQPLYKIIVGAFLIILGLLGIVIGLFNHTLFTDVWMFVSYLLPLVIGVLLIFFARSDAKK